MTTDTSTPPAPPRVPPRAPRAPRPGPGALSRLACLAVQPILSRTVRRIAARHPSLFARLGPHQTTDFLIDPVELPFALHLRPDPEALIFRAVPRDAAPRAGAVIRGRFMLLLELVDSEEDGDAAFFSRDLEVSGDTEAVVRLRNALDDVDGSIAEETAAMFGRPGRAILARLRRAYLNDSE
ncbi:ubiquinone anaerobic biosynthesis accessory factor UbiT [Alterinioella nitratireducens]|uniref:ubiquinone anaerobic biosynthesis accessory factor UbiT n=1 Tax=Alterinioella nitratireducens TaxID=2735915 RepID=UPI00155701DB|nr:SCP2 sterol-binding domain-containing protein [Alterinioella nitratireducens]NPD20898.1 sterol-binding protein [Alterinioella nitratireducens]